MGEVVKERVESAARAIWEASRADEGTISYIGANKVAAALEARGLLGHPSLTDRLAEEIQDGCPWRLQMGNLLMVWCDEHGRTEHERALETALAFPKPETA